MSFVAEYVAEQKAMGCPADFTSMVADNNAAVSHGEDGCLSANEIDYRAPRQEDGYSVYGWLIGYRKSLSWLIG